jgi:hypothetical protein
MVVVVEPVAVEEGRDEVEEAVQARVRVLEVAADEVAEEAVVVVVEVVTLTTLITTTIIPTRVDVVVEQDTGVVGPMRLHRPIVLPSRMSNYWMKREWGIHRLKRL